MKVLQLLAKTAAGDATTTPADGEVTEVAIDILAILAGVGAGVVLGLVLSVIVQLVFRAALRRHEVVREAVRRTLVPLRFCLVAVGGWFGLEFATQTVAPSWKNTASHVLLIATILTATWFIAAFVNGLKDVTLNRLRDAGITRYRRAQTQMQILNRLVLAAIWIIGFAAVLLTFEVARSAGASIFASAGLISVVAGIAAQSTLGNVFAGLQLAFSDSIRMGDIVIWQKEYAKVEDITLTYVVLKIWDGRRLIVPSTLLTSQTFENWTRQDMGMLGYVDFFVDWSAPIPAMRHELDRILSHTDLWNGETGIIQVRATEGTSIKVSALVSAATPSALVDLQYYVREHMLRWIQAEYPDIVPHGRNYFTPPDPLQGVEGLDAAESEGASIPEGMREAAVRAQDRQRAGRELSEPVSGTHAPISSVSKDIASERREVRERRLQLPYWKRAKTSEIVKKTPPDLRESHSSATAEDMKGASVVRTPVAQRGEYVFDPVETGHESSIFTGSLAALKRAEDFSGPGEAVLKERTEAVRKKKSDADSAAVDAERSAADEASGEVRSEAGDVGSKSSVELPATQKIEKVEE